MPSVGARGIFLPSVVTVRYWLRVHAAERRALYAWIQELSGAENVLLPEELLRQAQRGEAATPREREIEQLRRCVRPFVI
jgi:hypothetical protein